MSRTRSLLVLVLLGTLAGTLAAHDLFLKLADYLVRPNAEVRVVALNGTFTTSENSIARPRVADIAVVGPAGRQHLDTTALSAAGPRTVIRFRTGAPGTYVAGLSIRPSEITLTGPQFNGYLEEEGISGVLEARRSAGELAKPAKERYAKHVKVIFQAGPTRSNDWSSMLGYPVEIVPLQNPYALRRGDTLRVQLLVNGAKAAGQEAIAGGRTTAGARHREQHLRSGDDGVIPIALSSTGTWYVKFINMTRATEPGLDYLSQWATLTFAVPPAPGKIP